MRYLRELRHFFERSMQSGCMLVDLQNKIQLCLTIDKCKGYFERMGFVGVEVINVSLEVHLKIIETHRILLIR